MLSLQNNPFVSLRRERLFQLLRFGATGATATSIHAAAAAAYLFTRGADASAWAATLIGFSCAFLWSFVGHTYFVFRYPGSAARVFPRFVTVSAATFTISMLVSVVANGLGFSRLLAVGLVILVVPIVSYLGNLWWVFRTSE
ncbi:MAG: GtrA family protein [Qipengyuania sp.]|jgi:putative flippase GtrA|nr:GtrA family protein [Qipengyuania sp.]